MKLRILPITLLALFISPAGHADFNFGVKAGTMLVGFDNDDVSEDPVSVAASLGYSFASVSGLSVEVEATRTASAGMVTGNELEVDSQGVYIAYETAGRVYLKGRIGYMDASLSAGDLSEDEGGETYGIAIGWRISGFNLELDYTAVDDDVTFVSLGVRF